MTQLAKIWTMAFASLVATQPSFAQSAGNKAAAEALFDQGRLLAQSGDYPQACQKFEASKKLDEGIGTLLYLADCYEKTGRTASAWATFKEAASMAGAQRQETRQKLANQRAQALESGLIKIVIDVAKGDESLLGFEVRNDGAPIPPGQFGIAVPIDPGEHHIEASAPSKQSYTEVIRVTKGVGRISVPLLADLPASKTAAAQKMPVESKPAHSSSEFLLTPTAPHPSTLERDTAPGKGQRIVAIVLGGAGVVSTGIGTYFGLTAIHHNNASKASCPSNDVGACYNNRLSQYNDAVREARISTVAIIAGGALLATGVVLYLTAPDKGSTVKATAAAGPNAALLSVGGNW